MEFHPWRHSKPKQTRSWATGCWWPCWSWGWTRRHPEVPYKLNQPVAAASHPGLSLLSLFGTLHITPFSGSWGALHCNGQSKVNTRCQLSQLPEQLRNVLSRKKENPLHGFPCPLSPSKPYHAQHNTEKNQPPGPVAISVLFYSKPRGILQHYAHRLGNIELTLTVHTRLCLISAQHGQLPAVTSHIWERSKHGAETPSVLGARDPSLSRANGEEDDAAMQRKTKASEHSITSAT